MDHDAAGIPVLFGPESSRLNLMSGSSAPQNTNLIDVLPERHRDPISLIFFLYHYSLFRLCFSRWIEHFWKRNKDLAHLVTSCTKAAVTRSSRYPAVLHTSLAKKNFVKRAAREAEKYAVGHLLVSTLTKFQGSAMILASKKKDLSTGRSNWAPSDGCLQAP